MKQKNKNIIKFSKIIDEIDDSIFITNKSGIITYINKAFSQQTEYSKKEAYGQTPNLLSSGKQNNTFYARLWNTILSGNVFRATVINKKKSGGIYYENETITPIKDKRKRVIGFISTGKDVTEETLHNQELCRIAATDKLTGIYNRHKFEELFLVEVERSNRFRLPLSMILLDIDNFKLINDTYGHSIGDDVLKHSVAVIQKNIRKLDILSRWGGEEFLVLTPGSNLEDTQQLAEKLRLAIYNEPFDKIDNITVSIGLSTLQKEDTFVQLFERTDKALYDAKKNGKNRVACTV